MLFYYQVHNPFSRSKMTEKLEVQSACTQNNDIFDFACIENYMERQIGCKIPWSFPPTTNFHCKETVKFIKRLYGRYIAE